MKRIEIPEEILLEMIRLYNEEYVGTPSLSEKFGYDKKVILRNFKSKGVEVGPSGRKWKGGKKMSGKRYYTNPNNIEKISKKNKEWSKNNRDHLKEYHAKWRQKNKEYYQKYKSNYEKNKKKLDPIYRLSCYTRTALYTSLKEKNINKYGGTFDILPYTLEELMKYLESKFKEGMTWDNYGEWHIDHIKPISSFIFESSEDDEFKKCWSLENLQPMWGIENIKKGNKSPI